MGVVQTGCCYLNGGIASYSGIRIAVSRGMGQKTFTGTGLFYLLLILWSVWYMVAAFAKPPLWFHIIGAVALFLTFFRIIRGDD
ncbi:MAG: hypothetical protein BGO54_02625 [Sphingobacteriales bacterium 46-32]|nr:MAG: hypothetical protein BGO54_02625 [Sphingobacteriales bacterium 46-32]